MAESAAVQGVSGKELAGNFSGDMSIANMFLHADIVVQIVILGLAFMSFVTWAIFFDKYLLLNATRGKCERFLKEFYATDSLDSLNLRAKNARSNPLARVFVSAFAEWEKSMPITAKTGDINQMKERISAKMDIAKNKLIDEVDKGLGFLATVGSSAPFIGLFGTVWGIMNAFTAIATSKNTSLAVVAPGIAEALFVTGVGLFAAIPAVIFYNYFNARIGRYEGRIEDFNSEFLTLISRQTEQQQVK